VVTGSNWSKVLVYGLLVVALVFFVTPILWTFLLAVRPTGTNLTQPPTLFFQPVLDHLRYTFANPGVSMRYLYSSVVIALGSTALSLPFSMPAAYAFARYRFKGRKGLMFWFLGIFLGPQVVFLLPYVILMNWFNLVGTYISMILVFQTLTIPFSLLIMKSFIEEIPVELEESALVDGASRLRAAVSVVLPLALPGLIVSAMFAFVFAWNNAAYPLVLSSQATKPLPVGTLDFFATTGISWNYIAATSFVTMLPPMILFLSLEKYLARGLTFGAVKG
jgi:multiple sugar transport system permease protein